MCLEFLKTKDGQDRVVEVLRISQDGMQVGHYQYQFRLSSSFEFSKTKDGQDRVVEVC